MPKNPQNYGNFTDVHCSISNQFLDCLKAARANIWYLVKYVKKSLMHFPLSSTWIGLLLDTYYMPNPVFQAKQVLKSPPQSSALE
jgi:hypothetical protein